MRAVIDISAHNEKLQIFMNLPLEELFVGNSITGHENFQIPDSL